MFILEVNWSHKKEITKHILSHFGRRKKIFLPTETRNKKPTNTADQSTHRHTRIPSRQKTAQKGHRRALISHGNTHIWLWTQKSQILTGKHHQNNVLSQWEQSRLQHKCRRLPAQIHLLSAAWSVNCQNQNILFMDIIIHLYLYYPLYIIYRGERSCWNTSELRSGTPGRIRSIT